MRLSRRTLLSSLAGSALALGAGTEAGFAAEAGAAAAKGPAARALARLLPGHRDQVTFRTVPRAAGRDRFRVSGGAGRILVEGSTPAVQLTGFHTYLRQVAHAHISWAGEQTRLPDRLPAVPEPIERTANVTHRFVFNDTNDGYTGTYHDWTYWERELDVLALHGYNEVLVYLGADSVYHRTFLQHGYADAELRSWIPGPSHQPWWLLQNMSGFGGPVSGQLMDQRAKLAARIVNRLRELGMTPVLPGYFGTVPPSFATRNPGAHVVPQGTWVGFNRPDWLDPRSDHFARIAATFYRVQTELLGATSMYKMDLLHEGGTPGDVPIGPAAKAVEKALRTAHPGAIWNLLGWQENPHREIIEAVDKTKLFIVDGLSDRFPSVTDREQSWEGAPYAFGSIWNFGGHTAMGANTPDWASLYESWRTKPDSALDGIALMPEGADNNPAAFALFSDLPWTDGPLDLETWFGQWPTYRYGAADSHAAQAWDVLRRTAYGTTREDSWSEGADGLFGARPSLTVKSAASWSPQQLRYDADEFDAALPALLAVAPPLRSTTAYRYDLMDVTRQTLSNRSRVLLPQIREAYESKNKERFDGLTGEWFRCLALLERVVATDRGHLLGRWVADARSWGATASEKDQLAYDAVSLLTVWGPRGAANGGGLRDYANREWSGLVGGLYTLRWRTYFATLSTSLTTGRPPTPVDWYALEDKWVRTHPGYEVSPAGDVVGVAGEVKLALGL
ncbi:alpha-N-acetylglucosaminidase [Streptomyces violascens]|uniref:Alpha-N-acetylglucosaminidase n=1 Tax=Streptomyces violascens TaxID=67381 RepID=A0ABQ3QP07_9ACTN|nr:alpha-N-acetylglucosaminidase [Streptomyces violascens]GGU10200.1 alpha-N-acetylglucosaminidase [Streptomyces violascens]GHI39007.1 alpha-N-acetylglucosaminidase [Streptomyces violascens]